MKTFKALYIDNGVIKAGEFPVEPKKWASGDSLSYNEAEWQCYKEALASAKANAVECEDQTLAATLTNGVKEGDVFVLASGWDYVEKVRVCTDDCTCAEPCIVRVVAKLYRTDESQENLCYELFRPAYKAADTGEYFRRGHHTSGRKINRDQFYRLLKMIKDNLEENFTITRKP